MPDVPNRTHVGPCSCGGWGVVYDPGTALLMDRCHESPRVRWASREETHLPPLVEPRPAWAAWLVRLIDRVAGMEDDGE